jgi:integrating conjugative element membrane protein (TIGR03747 family)
MPNNAAVNPSVGLKSITWPFRWAFWIGMLTMMSGALALGTGLYFHSYIWAGQGTAPFSSALETLLVDAALASDLWLFGSNALELTMFLSDGAYTATFVWTGLEEAYFLAKAGASPSGLDAALYRFLLANAETVEVAMLIARLYGAKAAMLVGALPLFVLVYLVAMVDGLTARYIRKQGGGRESAFIYHRAKWAIVMLIGSAVVFLLLLPLSYSPRWLLPSMALVIGVLARTQWAYYKKYL